MILSFGLKIIGKTISDTDPQRYNTEKYAQWFLIV